jgi:CO/xanthine dehydrogenase Mo-binding subunit
MYSADMMLPEMLYGKVLPSRYPHARVRRLDTTKAESLEGVIAVVTAADVPGGKSGKEPPSAGIWHLAREKVFFAGQPVAAVAALDPLIAEEALGLIEVDYEELPPVMDVLEAMKPEAILIHPELYTNLNTESRKGKASAPSNVVWQLEFGRGDVEAGFREADVVLENTFRTQAVHQGYLEPQTTVAKVDFQGKVTVWSSSQGIFRVREQVAGFLNIPLSRVKVEQVEVGGGFGGKSAPVLAPLCALMAWKTGRPVKMVMTRAEDLEAARPAPAALITLKMGAARDGRLTAAAATLTYNEGAFPAGRPAALSGGVHGLGPYRIPNLKVEGYDVVTNRPPSGAYRAPSAPQGVFAVESQMDLLARELEMDPLELRLKNVVGEGDLMPNGVPFPKIGFRETIERMLKHPAYRSKPEGDNRGRGVACGFWRGGVGNSAAHVNVNADGSIVLVVGCVDLTGTRTGLAQMVAEEFGIPVEAVTVAAGDTETAPYSDVSVGSRTTHQMGTAVCRACKDAKDQLACWAAPRLEVEPGDVEFANKHARVKGRPEKCIPLATLVQDSIKLKGEGPVTGRGAVGAPPLVPMFAVQVADLEVDRETGEIRIRSYAAAQDVGRAINPTLVEGQIQGGVAQGIGWALTENYIYEKGLLQNASLMDYLMPTPADVPNIETLLVEIQSATGPFGIRGVGEPPIVPALATLANAIHSAAGVRLKELPMTPEVILRALKDTGHLDSTSNS